MNEIRKAGRRLDPGDLPPRLEWEEPAWTLYEEIESQWRRTGRDGRRYALDLGLGARLMRELGWNVPRGVALLKAIEDAVLEGDRERDD